MSEVGEPCSAPEPVSSHMLSRWQQQACYAARRCCHRKDNVDGATATNHGCLVAECGIQTPMNWTQHNEYPLCDQQELASVEVRSVGFSTLFAAPTHSVHFKSALSCITSDQAVEIGAPTWSDMMPRTSKAIDSSMAMSYTTTYSRSIDYASPVCF